MRRMRTGVRHVRLAVAGVMTVTIMSLAALVGGAGDAIAAHVAYVHQTAAGINAMTVPGTIPPASYALGTYVSGGVATGTSPANAYAWTGDATFDPTAANSLDHHWMQVSTAPLIMDMGVPTTSAIVFPSIDHGPVPYEALESTVWGSNNPAAPFPAGWTLATMTSVYRDGWVAAGAPQESDDWVSVWSFPSGSFRYIAVYANKSIDFTPDDPSTNDCAGDGVWCSAENEIDAVGRPLGPDLTITKDPKPGQPAPVPGGYYSFIIRVRNAGNTATPPPPRDVFVRDDLSLMGTFVFWTASAGVCTNNTPFVDCSRRSMAPGEEWWIEIRVRLPGKACQASDRAVVDPFNRIAETNEGNNTASLTIVPGVDRCIDTDGTATPGDGFANPLTAGSIQVFRGAPLHAWPTGGGFEGLDMFDNDGNAAWTFGPAGDDLHVEGPAHPGAIRNAFHDPTDPVVLDYNGSLWAGQPVNCDFEFGAFCPPTLPGLVKFFDSNGNGLWDNGEDIVLDVNGNGIFD